MIEPTLQAAEVLRSTQRPTDDITAYDLYLRARADAESWEKARMLRALDLVRQALEHDPHYGAALAVAVMCHAGLYVTGWSNDMQASRREALELARRSLLVAGDDPYVLANAAHAIGEFGEDIAAALSLIDRCLKLNPSFARGWLRSGWLRLWSGQPDLAIKHFETFTRLSPRENRAGPLLGIGVCHFFQRNLEEARTLLLGSLQENRTWAPTHRFLASCCAHLGRLEEAHEVVKRLREITPVVIPSADHWRIPEHREFYLQGLRMAAGE